MKYVLRKESIFIFWNLNLSVETVSAPHLLVSYPVFRCGTAQFKSILDYICQLEEEVVELKEKITDYSVANRRHEEICGNDDLITASKLNTMNDKVRLSISLLFCLH